MEAADLPEPVYLQSDFMLYAILKNKNYGAGDVLWADTAHDRAQDEAHDKYELDQKFAAK